MSHCGTQLHGLVLALGFQSYLGLVFPCHLPTFLFWSGSALYAIYILEACNLVFGFELAVSLTLNFGHGLLCYAKTVKTLGIFGDGWINLVFRDSQEPVGIKWNTLA